VPRWRPLLLLLLNLLLDAVFNVRPLYAAIRAAGFNRHHSPCWCQQRALR
jgi:hypothetical protein